MAPLLAHSPDIPDDARDALREAVESSSLVTAARILHASTGLDCDDAKELVGLPAGDETDCRCG